MLAPSFPIDFAYPQIVGKLKRLGFSKVVEVSKGAEETNKQLRELLLKNKNNRFITSPCPSIVRLVKTKFPELSKYLAKIDSPMSATAKLVKKLYPDLTPVFIGPCVAKKIESREDWPDLKIEVLTYLDLQKIFDENIIKEEASDASSRFDMIGELARIYPFSGGLAKTSHLGDFLGSDEIYVVDGYVKVESALKEFEKNSRIRVLDILLCDGGCIGGPGIINKILSKEERRNKVINYRETMLNCSEAS
jgi:iron only hydrogenase large subunit-like protein